MRALDRIGSFDNSRPFGPWFFRVLTNTGLNARRARDAAHDRARGGGCAVGGRRAGRGGGTTRDTGTVRRGTGGALASAAHYCDAGSRWTRSPRRRSPSGWGLRRRRFGGICTRHDASCATRWESSEIETATETGVTLPPMRPSRTKPDDRSDRDPPRDAALGAALRHGAMPPYRTPTRFAARSRRARVNAWPVSRPAKAIGGGTGPPAGRTPRFRSPAPPAVSASRPRDARAAGRRGATERCARPWWPSPPSRLRKSPERSSPTRSSARRRTIGC